MQQDIRRVTQNILEGIVILLGTLLSVLTLSSFLGRFHWLLDIFSHFHLQYAALLTLCFIVALLLRSKLLAVLLLPALLANAYLLAPFFLPQSGATHVSSAESAPPRTLRVMALNVYMDNRDYNAVSDYLREANADIVMLSENGPDLMRALKESVSDLYPYVYDSSTRGTYGLALLSRYPFQDAKSVSLGGRGRRILEVTLAGTAPVTIFGAHPLPPLGSRWAARRNDELTAIETFVKQSVNPTILLGDFNASPWSRPLIHLTETTALRFANLGLGIRPTWSFGAPLLGAPIDHIFVSPEWRVTGYEVGREVGSDHLPVVAELTLP